MQSKNKNDGVQLSTRYQQYMFTKRHLAERSSREVFPIGQDAEEIVGEHKKRKINVIGTTVGKEKGTNSRHWVHSTDGIIGAVNATEYKQPKQILQLNNPTHSNNRVYSEEGISPTLNTMQGGRRQPFIQSRPHGFNKGGKRELPNMRESAIQNELVVQPVLTPDRIKKRQNGRRMKNDGEPSFTLTAQDKHGVMIDAKIRRLTPVECMRLQGFPDSWCDVGADGKEISDSQKYKMAGNAVTVNVVKEIIKKLI